jgi:hypothetical protein
LFVLIVPNTVWRESLQFSSFWTYFLNSESCAQANIDIAFGPSDSPSPHQATGRATA